MTLPYKTIYVHELTSYLHPVFHQLVKRGLLYDFAVGKGIHTRVDTLSASRFSPLGKMGSTLRLCLTKRYT